MMWKTHTQVFLLGDEKLSIRDALIDLSVPVAVLLSAD